MLKPQKVLQLRHIHSIIYKHLTHRPLGFHGRSTAPYPTQPMPFSCLARIQHQLARLATFLYNVPFYASRVVEPPWMYDTHSNQPEHHIMPWMQGEATLQHMQFTTNSKELPGCPVVRNRNTLSKHRYYTISQCKTDIVREMLIKESQSSILLRFMSFWFPEALSSCRSKTRAQDTRTMTCKTQRDQKHVAMTFYSYQEALWLLNNNVT